MPAPYAGRCLCGAIEYRLNDEPVTFYACHCTDCQKRSGSGFALSMWVKRAALEIAKGDPVVTAWKAANGAPRRYRDCPECGTRLRSEPGRFPDLSVLRPGTLDDPRQFTPVLHMWTRSALPWVKIPEGAARYEKQVGSFEEMLTLWRERAGG
jgi:hypothetical protein